MEPIKPSDIKYIHPFDSIIGECNHEIIAKNIIIIQSRLENKFQLIDWDIYYFHRIQDGNFSEKEIALFDKVAPMLTTESDVRKFSKCWDINPLDITHKKFQTYCELNAH